MVGRFKIKGYTQHGEIASTNNSRCLAMHGGDQTYSFKVPYLTKGSDGGAPAPHRTHTTTTLEP